MTTIQCPECGVYLNIDEEYVGKFGTCKKCGKKIQAIPVVVMEGDADTIMFEDVLEPPKRKPAISVPPVRAAMDESTKKIIWGAILAVVILITFSIAHNTVSQENGGKSVQGRENTRIQRINQKNNGFQSSTKPEAGFSMPSFGRQNVTFAHYSQIQNGMSYEQVVNIIGMPGEELSQNRMEAIPGVMDAITTVMYQWMNGNGSNMNAMFQNNKLIQKAQFGLK